MGVSGGSGEQDDAVSDAGASALTSETPHVALISVLDDAPQGYKDFDKGAAKKFVIAQRAFDEKCRSRSTRGLWRSLF
ncbi:MAG TPA: hypothetical protein VK814_01355 [Acidobacteriaceae bacterium]|nr:hypothetical protein [Acidobacteriaceae bacterium]